jgi:hypothetical protein
VLPRAAGGKASLMHSLQGATLILRRRAECEVAPLSPGSNGVTRILITFF